MYLQGHAVTFRQLQNKILISVLGFRKCCVKEIRKKIAVIYVTKPHECICEKINRFY